MESLYNIEPIHLRTHEINYELKIRGLQPSKSDIVSKRKCLRECLRTETQRTDLQYQTPKVDFNVEKAEIEASFMTLEELASDFDGLREEVFRRFNSRYCHLLGRLLRTPEVEGETDVKAYRDEKIVALKSMMTDVREIVEKNKPSLFTKSSGSVEQTSKSIPVFKWGISYDGSPKSGSVNSFLQRVEELRVARSTTEEMLFNSAVDLFTGSALVWYRAVRGTLTNWENLKTALRKDFLPINFDDELMAEIRDRTQGEHERLTVYIATMLNLFSRLSVQPTEEEKLHIIKKNLLPYLQIQLALQTIPDVATLTETGRIIENANLVTKKYQPPPRKNLATLEPDLAYSQCSRSVESTSTNQRNSTLAMLQCWNCNQPGHLKRDCRKKQTIACHGCGRAGVIKPNCPSCSRKFSKTR